MLILVLITVVGLTIGLSLVSRTITDVRISSQIEQSGRAFSAAEAGVEEALRGSFNISQNEGSLTLNGASANYSMQDLGGTNGQLTFPMTSEGDIQTLWLIDHNTDGTLNESGYSFPSLGSFDLCWGSSVTNQAAVSLTLLYKQGSSYKTTNSSYDGLSRGNNFVLAEAAGGYCYGSFRV